MKKIEIIAALRFLMGIAAGDKSVSSEKRDELYTAVDEAVALIKEPQEVNHE
mgnify:CR=1 FL=1